MAVLMNRTIIPAVLVSVVVVQGAQFPPGIRFLAGPVNGLLIHGKVLIYGDASGHLKNIPYVLFTDARRDKVWAGTALIKAGAESVVPERERELFSDPKKFWANYETSRFHDYSQVNTKVLAEPLQVSRAVKGGEAIRLAGTQIQVIDTPGYTRGSVSYVFEDGGKRIACTGDLIYGDGQILDLSSLQDAIPQAEARGYHGFAARAGDLVESLRQIAALKPDLLVPAHGPVIDNPQVAIQRLIERLQDLMTSHFETDALLWYWGEANLRVRSKKVLEGHKVISMPMAEQRPLPTWAKAIGNSRLLLSRTGAGFVIDAGYKGLNPELDQMKAKGELKSIDGIWITHYHDDHTDYAQETADRFKCPIYFTKELTDILLRPSFYRLPCLTTNPITAGKPRTDGAHMNWNEFEFTFHSFPGQTLYHDGLLVQRDGGDALFFVGDSFTPSGIDDYCLQNRNIQREGEGYLYCLRMLDHLPNNVWLINQHVEPTFRFSAEQRDKMHTELLKRMAILKAMLPWPDINYGVDESWASVHPYGSTARVGERVKLQVEITNHAPISETYRVHWNVPIGWRLIESDRRVAIESHKLGTAKAIFVAGTPGLNVVTVDVNFSGRELKHWTEALVRVN